MVANATYTRSTSLAPNESRNYPRFFIETVRDENASRQTGRDTFRDEERVEIVMPGNPYTRPILRVTDEHRQIWPKQYEAFKAGQEIAIEGTPLEAWAHLRPHRRHELKALGFRTVEQLARMDDQAVTRVGHGGRDLLRNAQAFVDGAERMAAVERLSAENDAKAAEIADLKLRLHGLEQTLARTVASRNSAATALPAASLDEVAKPSPPSAS